MKRTHRKSHKKELSETQYLKLENKKLRDENRTLKKQIKQLQRQEHYHEDTRLEEEAEQMSFDLEPPVPKCPECFRPTLKEIHVVGRNWTYCEACDYDSRKKK